MIGAGIKYEPINAVYLVGAGVKYEPLEIPNLDEGRGIKYVSGKSDKGLESKKGLEGKVR